jgi:hypothetical protein
LKKIIFLLLVSVAAFCPVTMNAQITTPVSPCDSIQMLFNEALPLLDSLMGVNNQLKRQLNERRLELNKTQKLVSGQAEKIQALEAEIKRLGQLNQTSKQKKS